MDNLSVVNTDAFDRRRFQEIFNMSDRFYQLEQETDYPLFRALLGDVWACLYKMKPEIRKGEIDSRLQLNLHFIQQIMAHEQFVSFRRVTRLDDFVSAIGAIKFGEMINRWLTELRDADKDFDRMFVPNNSRCEWERLDDRELHVIEVAVDRSVDENSNRFNDMIAAVMQESKWLKFQLQSLLGGLKSGDGEASLKKVPLRHQFIIADKMMENKQLKEIAEWAGRFKQIARTKQRTTTLESVEKSGVTIGNSIDALVPIEYSYYSHPLTKTDFLRRLAEGQTLQYEQQGREVLGRGPIVLCLDQSDSMSGLDAPSKGFSLALLAIAKKQRRDFCVLLFSTTTRMFIYKKGKVKVPEVVKLTKTYLGGGTNFSCVLEEAVAVMKESRFRAADLILVTDGEDEVDESFLTTFQQAKEEKGFQVLSLVLGQACESVKNFSDRVVQITDYNDEGIFTAFEV